MKSVKCKHCSQEIEYEVSANFIVFCPYCKNYVFLICERGFGPVVPCRILLGREEIAKVTYEDGTRSTYRYDSDKFHLHKVLKETYYDALLEAVDLTALCLTPQIKEKKSD